MAAISNLAELLTLQVIYSTRQKIESMIQESSTHYIYHLAKLGRFRTSCILSSTKLLKYFLTTLNNETIFYQRRDLNLQDIEMSDNILF
jgi:hypothetical protein